jgi:hypothetical protein
MTGIINHGRNHVATAAAHGEDENFLVACARQIDTEKPLPGRRHATPVGVNGTLAAGKANGDRLQRFHCLGGSFGAAARHILEPRLNQLVTFFNPTFVRHRPRMRVRRRRANHTHGQTGGATHRRPDLVRALIGEDLNIDIQDERGRGIISQHQRRGPEIHVDAFGLLMLLRTPTTMRNVGRRVDAPAASAGAEGVGLDIHEPGIVRPRLETRNSKQA